jgi:4-aminobutyrate aminotransferase
MKNTQRPPGHLNQDNLDRFRSEGELNISQRRKTWQEQHLDHDTREWLAKDAKYFLHQSLSTPCINVLASCKGSFLEDLQGNRFLDFHGNNVHQVGFGHERVIAAIREQMDTLSFCTRRYTNKPAIELAQKLVELAPGNLNKVLLAPGGTNAIGMALKLARMATGRFKTLSMWDAFHGASLDAISIGGEAIFRNGIGPLLPGTEHVPPPDPQHCPWDCGTACSLKCAEYVEYVLEKEGDIGAVVAETVRSTPFIPPKDYWKIIREACDRHGTLLILDEIPHCLGRTGKMFTSAASAAIEVIEAEGLLDNARELGDYALKKLQAMKAKCAMIGDVRGLGLLMGMELVKTKDTKERAIDLAEDVMYRCLAKGLSFKLSMGSILTLTPPLTVSQAEIDQAFDIIDECLAEVGGSENTDTS